MYQIVFEVKFFREIPKITEVLHDKFGILPTHAGYLGTQIVLIAGEEDLTGEQVDQMESLIEEAYKKDGCSEVVADFREGEYSSDAHTTNIFTISM